MRRTLLPNYSNSLWSNTGEKYSYLRFKKIVTFAHEFAPVLCPLWEKGLDEHWNMALTNLDNEFGTRLSNKSMTAFLSEIKKINK